MLSDEHICDLAGSFLGSTRHHSNATCSNLNDDRGKAGWLGRVLTTCPASTALAHGILNVTGLRAFLPFMFFSKLIKQAMMIPFLMVESTVSKMIPTHIKESVLLHLVARHKYSWICQYALYIIVDGHVTFPFGNI